MSDGYELLGRRDLDAASKPKSLFADKRERGVALIIGGSSRFHGAPVLASLAALRVGAGYAKTFVPKAVVDAVRRLSPNVIVNALGGNSIKFNKELEKEIGRADAVAVGMGAGNSNTVALCARKIINSGMKNEKTVVVDADAIMALKGIRHSRLNGHVIATPHDLEFYRVSGRRLSKSLAARIREAKGLARSKGIVVVLKGHNTIVTDGKRIKVCKPRSGALATMGTGDALSGIICGYAAQGATPFEAACAGVYLHASIGDKLAKKKGMHIIASDVVDAIPLAIKEFDKSY